MNEVKTRIKAHINDIRYQSLIKTQIKIVDIDKFDINDVPSSCVIRDGINEIAISKWVSPKRTRSYPYARVYDTISKNKRATIIPVVKDEGISGDRDFLQWDTICLMSLLQVSVIIAYYESASKNHIFADKITSQKINNSLIKENIHRLMSTYHSDALHWNIRQLKDELPKVIRNQIASYNEISKSTGVTFHDSAKLLSFQEVIDRDLEEFMGNSRLKAEQAQTRELSTVHVYENLETATKSSITITNIVGGKYFFTVDEIIINNETRVIHLIEAKHTGSSVLPSKADIKDGLLKMILYSNLVNIEVEHLGQQISNLAPLPVLRLTSPHVTINIDSNEVEKLETWCSAHGVKKQSSKNFIRQLFEEALANNFLIQIRSFC